MKGGGCGERMGRVVRGSPSGTSVITGQTFLATGLYFFIAKVDRLFRGGDANDGEEL